MATKKSASKKGAGKSASKQSSGARPKPISQAIYGQAIRDALARDDAAELRRVRSAAGKHVADIQSALKKLDAKLGKS